MKHIILTCIMLHQLVWCPAGLAQTVKVSQANTPSAYSRMFSISIGLDLPSFRRETGYYAYQDLSLNGTQVPNLWRNAYINYSWRRSAQITPMVGIGYYPAERWDIAIAAGTMTDYLDDFNSLRVARAYLNLNYRPLLAWCRRWRPVCGLQLSWDERVYRDYRDLSFYEHTSYSTAAGILTGLRVATGRWLWGVDLTTLFLSKTIGNFYWRYAPAGGSADTPVEATGEYEHLLDLPEALDAGYAFGHFALHCSFTILER